MSDDTIEIRVFTFKEGLLSRVAHDLRLHPSRVELVREGEGEDIVVRVGADSLVVDGAMRDGRLDAHGLGARDRAKILDTVRAEILRARQHPEIVFRGRVLPAEGPDGEDRVHVRGELELAGVKRALSFVATRSGPRLLASVTLRPSEFGIRPYKALAGAIRLQDRVRVELDVPGQLA